MCQLCILYIHACSAFYCLFLSVSLEHVALHKLFGAYRGTAVSISKCIRPVLECYPVTAKLLNTRSISDIRDKIRGFAKKY